ncbi:permease [Aerosakkonemataceae cyanobacterium BLCC-F154]|uniref:Permease n=1 Tax=Floridaenema fluviatile BLCC-F154 TaxID=3153640 RepID=A0ABV4YIE6_9CYAN
MNQLHNGFTLFLSLLVEALPFLLLGVLFSGLLLLFVDERKLANALPRNALLGAFVGSLIGFLFPVCECGNVPVARRLITQGVPTPVAIGFLLAAPTVNPIVIWATWTAFRDQPEIVVLRVIFSLTIATIIGWVFSAQADLRPLLQTSVANSMPTPTTKRRSSWFQMYQEEEPAPALLQSGSFLLSGSGQAIRMDAASFPMNAAVGTGKSFRSLKYRLGLFLDNSIQELRELGAILIIGSAIAAAIQVTAPRELILSLGQGPITSIVAMMVLAAVVSICSTVDAFFALSFASVFTPASLLAFLVFGPMIDLKAIGLMLTIFKSRAVIYIFALAAQFTFLFTLIYQMIY